MRMTRYVLGVALIAGCGGKKDDKPADKPADKTAETAAEKPAEPAATKPADKPAEPAAAADTSHGTCRIVVKGPITVDETLPHTGGSMLNVYQWHTAEMRSQMGYKDEGMILNCLGTGARFNILSKDALPTKPGTYKLGKGGAFTVMGELKGTERLTLTHAEGTVEITAFDTAHIAGKLTAKGQTLPKTDAVDIEITFDMQCYGLSGCVKK